MQTGGHLEDQSLPGRLLAGKRVCVAGAGLAGIAFGLSLLKLCKEKGIWPIPDVRLFDRESSADSRVGIGYSLGVRSDSGGVQVLQRLGVLDAALLHEEPSEGMFFANASFGVLAKFSMKPTKDAPVGVLRISRSKLRQVLLQHFPKEQVTFGKTCVGATQPDGPEGPMQLQFQDGTSEECDILVVADGARSKVRQALRPEETLSYGGTVGVLGQTGVWDPMPEVVARGQWMVLAPNGVSVFIQRLNRNTMSWNMSWYAPEAEAARIKALLQDPASAQEFLNTTLKEKAAHFGSPWPEVFERTPLSSLQALNPVEKLPHTNRAPVVFIGDSCHPMVPYSGNGANMAFVDAWQLAEQLTTPGNATLDAAVAAYDAEAVPRSSAALKFGTANMSMCHRVGWKYYASCAVLWLLGRGMSFSSAIMWWAIPIWRVLGNGISGITVMKKKS